MHKKVQRYRQLHAIALAYSEMQHSQQVRFEYDIVEPDSARFGKRATEDGSARTHVGRTLRLKEVALVVSRVDARVEASWLWSDGQKHLSKQLRNNILSASILALIPAGRA